MMAEPSSWSPDDLKRAIRMISDHRGIILMLLLPHGVCARAALWHGELYVFIFFDKSRLKRMLRALFLYL